MYKTDLSLEVCFQPIFYFFLLFASGICLEKFLDIPKPFLFITLAASLLTTFMLYLFKSYGKKLTLCIFISFLLIGSLLSKIEKDKTSNSIKIIDKELYSSFNESPKVEIYGKILAYPKITPKSLNLDIKTTFINKTGHPFKSNLIVRLSIWTSEIPDNLKLTPGTSVYVLAELLPQQKFKNPGVINTRDLLIQQGYDFAASIKSYNSLEILYQKPPSLFFRTIYKIHNHLINRIEENFSLEKAGILKAIILGDDNYLETNIAENFRLSGLYHILVISGSHIAFLTFVLYKIVGLISKNRFFHFLVTTVFIWIYALITGLESPIVRAVLMATVALIAVLFYRKIKPSNNIGVAGLLLLAIHPNALFETSFQLTFLAISPILLLVIPLTENLRKIGSWFPSSKSPHPPECSGLIKTLAELLFWSEKNFIQKQKESLIKYRLEKNSWAVVLEKYKLQKPFSILVLMFFTSLTVQLSILPLSVIYFNRVAFIAIILNIISEILMSILLIGIMIFFILDFISLNLGSYFIYIIDFLLTLFANTAWPSFCDQINNQTHLLSYRVANFANWQIIFYIIYYLCGALIIIKVNRWEIFLIPNKTIILSQKIKMTYLFNSFLSIFLILCLLIIILPKTFYQTLFPNRFDSLEVVFLDVGQGDAIFIEFPKGTKMMIDSGGSSIFTKHIKAEKKFSIGEQVDSKYLWSRGIEHLDFIVATHPHQDHIEGFTDILKNFSVGQVILPQDPEKNVGWKSFINEIKPKNIPINIWSKGETYFIDGVKIDVLWPEKETSQDSFKQFNKENKEINNQSLVLYLSYQGYSLLLTGDIEKEVEKVLVEEKKDFSAEVIKSPHHGSKTSNSELFVRKINPIVSIISAPVKSQFNHPHLEVTQRYKALDIAFYQTGLSGAITIFIEGETIYLKEFINPNKKIYLNK
jgi:competence protein ComEC